MRGRPFNVNSLVNGILQRSPGCAFHRFTKAGAVLAVALARSPEHTGAAIE